ncbi:MAG: winged helix-turn-helix domain-containing protein [Candidatus Acidiferrum sp.]
MYQASNRTTRFRFGVFEADLNSAELRKNGSKIKLQEQPFQVLAVLLEKPGEVVTREELRASLWPEDTFVDFDHGVNAAIKRLRDALGDSAESPRFVETLARRGYRFIAPVTDATNDGQNGKRSNETTFATKTPAPVTSSDAPAPGITSRELAPQRFHHWRFVVAAAALLVVGTSAGWVAAHRLTPHVRISEARLTNNPPDDPIVSAVLSPDAKYLAFADRAGLFVREVATGETQSVSIPGGTRPRPKSWFPDGGHLLVTTAEPESLWSVSLLGGSPRKLIDNADGSAVSPDGSQIAFVRGDWPGQEVWLMSGDGERAHKIISETGAVFGSIAWSPRGDKLAFVRYLYRTGHHESENSLEIFDVHASAAHPILSDNRLSDGLVWAADGHLIYSLLENSPSPAVKSGDGDSNFWTMAVNLDRGEPSGESRRLTNGWDRKMSASLSSDGKRLVFLRWSGEAHVYVADLDPGLRQITTPKRLSLEEGRNFPYSWTPDGKSVIFVSDRAGQSRLFRQGVDQPTPDLLVGGTDSVAIARPSPDGSQVFYLARDRMKGTSGQMRLMRVPLSGGAPELILEHDIIDNFQCARLPSTICVYGQSFSNGLRFIAFDPATGKERPLAHDISGLKYNWSLSPDGTTLALSPWRKPELRLISTKDGSMRTLPLQGGAAVSSIDWAFDSQTLWATSSTYVGTQSLLNIDLRGRVRPMFQDPDKDVGWVIPSPDGKRIAFWESSGSSNVWMMQGF